MMGDRLGQTNRNYAFEAGSSSKIDLLLRSESPRVQQILLHQQLKEDIEKNSTGKVRYVDSELYLRNQERSPAFSASEVQSTTLNIGVPSTARQTSRITITPTSTNKRDHQNIASDGVDSVESGCQIQPTIINRNCHTCMIKEVRQDLMNINKMVQEQTAQIRQLRSKCIRSYFERLRETDNGRGSV